MNELQIDLMPEFLDEGPDYEKAAFGLLEIKAGSQLLTAAIRVKGDERHWDSGPYVSGYHLVEWLVWNWWRLRWEPRPPSNMPSYDWDMSHCMPAIGEGYFWPNITISSDGFQCDLTSERSNPSDSPFFYYIGAPAATIPATDVESAIDRFARFILEQLSSSGIHNTNLQTLWDDLESERTDPEVARFRRIEALLGFDPDEAGEEHIEQWIRDKDVLGESALEELAAATVHHMLSARQISDTTKSFGFDVSIDNAFRLGHLIPMRWGQQAAWNIGVAAANAVRQQAGLADQPIDNQKLAELSGISATSLTSEQSTNSLSWVLRQGSNHCRAVFRSPWKTNRRFDLARLIGDRLFSESDFTAYELLTPATRSYSYRQKAQRAFAAELLSPWESVNAMLDNDYSLENQEQVADHFAVSQMTISTLVANHEGIGREYLS